MDPSDLFDWLLDSDIHVILTHPHQGVPRWNVVDVYRGLQTLKSHCGYPTGIQIECPVFLQHNDSYLVAIRHIANPTIAVQLPEAEMCKDIRGNTIYSTSTSPESFNVPLINDFLDKNNPGLGWVVKLPFTTVREGLKFCGTKAYVFHALQLSTVNF